VFLYYIVISVLKINLDDYVMLQKYYRIPICLKFYLFLIQVFVSLSIE
jgi:hypothetical protein